MKPSPSHYSSAGGPLTAHRAAKLTALGMPEAGRVSKSLAPTADNSSACETCSLTNRAAQPSRKPLYLFAALQLLDFATTLAALHFGGRELNSLVSSMFPLIGLVGAVLVCKLLLIAIAIAASALGKVRAVTLANYVYVAIVAWNVQIIVRLIERTA